MNNITTENKTNICLLLVGVPLAGKTTFVKTYKKRFNKFVILSRDESVIAVTNIKNYNEAWDYAEKNKLQEKISDHFFSLLDSAVSKGKNIIIDNTNINRKPRYLILSRIPNHYLTCSIFFPVTQYDAIERNKIRENKIIPLDVLDRMFSNLSPPGKEGEFDLSYNLDQFTSFLTDKIYTFPDCLFLKNKERQSELEKQRIELKRKAAFTRINRSFSSSPISFLAFSQEFLKSQDQIDRDNFTEQIAGFIEKNGYTYTDILNFVNEKMATDSYKRSIENEKRISMALRAVILFNESHPDNRWFLSQSLIETIVLHQKHNSTILIHSLRKGEISESYQKINRYYFNHLYEAFEGNPIELETKIKEINDKMTQENQDELHAIYLGLLRDSGIGVSGV